MSLVSTRRLLGLSRAAGNGSYPQLPAVASSAVGQLMSVTVPGAVPTWGWTTADALIASVFGWKIVTDYGAVGDTQAVYDAVTTAGSGVVTSAAGLYTADSVGKTISIGGAGTAGRNFVSTIASYQSAGQVTMAAPATASVTAQSCYWGTDDTVAIQAAIDATAVGNRTTAAGPATLFFPPKVYMIAGAIDAGNWLGQLHLPIVPYNATAPTGLTLRGSGAANTQWDVATAVHAGFVPSMLGTILYTPIDGVGRTDLPALISGGKLALTAFSNVSLKMQDLTIRTPTVTNMTGVNAWWVGQCEIDGVTVDIDGVTPADNTANAYGNGIVMPSKNNAAWSFVRSYQALGQQCALLAAEHTHVVSMVAMKCERAFQVNGPQNHPIKVDYIGAFHCQEALVAGGTTAASIGIVVGLLAVERDTGAPYTFAHDVLDHSNFFKGSVNYQSITQGTGAGNVATVDGATNLTLTRLK